MKKTFENPTCMRCGTPLKEVETGYEDEIEFDTKEFQCPYCGAIEMYYGCDDENKPDYPFYNDEIEDSIEDCSHGYDGLCPNCGHHIVWGSDFMRSEVLGDVEGQEYEYEENGKEKHPEFFDENGCLIDDSLASSVYCPHCGASIDIVDCKPSEYHKYQFYNND